MRRIARYLTAITLLALTACTPAQIANATHASRLSAAHARHCAEDDPCFFNELFANDPAALRALANCQESLGKDYCWVELENGKLAIYGKGR